MKICKGLRSVLRAMCDHLALEFTAFWN